MDLLANESMSDFQIVLKDHIYKVHKLILCRCEYFASLFSSQNKESITNSVNLPYTKEQFKPFLNHLYLDTKLYEEHEGNVDLLEIAIYLQRQSLIDQFQLSINNYKSNAFSKLFPLLLTRYPQFIYKMDEKTWNYNCNRYRSLIIDFLNNIKDESLVLKILNSVNNIKLRNIVTLINNWIDVNSIDLWSKIDKLNFCYDRESQDWLLINSEYMKYPFIADKVKSYHSLIFDSNNIGVISIDGKSISCGKYYHEKISCNSHYPLTVGDVYCEIKITKEWMIKFRFRNCEIFNISIKYNNGYICSQKSGYNHEYIDVGYALDDEDCKYNICISAQ